MKQNLLVIFLNRKEKIMIKNDKHSVANLLGTMIGVTVVFMFLIVMIFLLILVTCLCIKGVNWLV